MGDGPQSFSIEQWKGFFAGLFGGHVHHMTLETVGFHFIEEAGEAARAIRLLNQLRGVSEIHVGMSVQALAETLATAEGRVNLYRQFVKGDLASQMSTSSPEVVLARVVRAKMDVVVELADAFSWFCSVLNKVEWIAGNCSDGRDQPDCHVMRESFEARLRDEYMPEGKPLCPACHSRPCSCIFFPAK
jgi:hypothetical protein